MLVSNLRCRELFKFISPRDFQGTGSRINCRKLPRGSPRVMYSSNMIGIIIRARYGRNHYVQLAHTNDASTHLSSSYTKTYFLCNSNLYHHNACFVSHVIVITSCMPSGPFMLQIGMDSQMCFFFIIFNFSMPLPVKLSYDTFVKIWCHLIHIYVSKIIIDSDNGLSPGRHQAIIRTNVRILVIVPLGINLSDFFFIKINTFTLKDAFETVVCRMAYISTRSQWVTTAAL